ncbi:electron transport complex subunit RsxE [Pseudomonas sp. G11-1]|uniref:Ion-translocating oxidoreductase complex subunit E n=1 Tax=Halopseudomonas bauzanensis TaxID=653930 RepID=A0A031MIQ3_9GAMM|nr:MULTISPECIES: electron transport complex subunit E [Halopseudomonas]MCO5784775.1 electron transport complex subunit RsxE [Pseudomonas sp. G11-1]MCO5789122.1 electron transport complex subunit RsxE [Pseudomonas sp. G11-2]EZQ19880.1 electron transporter RnfE [Halopseudomonas bauzanensis]TKA91687.1 electron transport complex subunit E [Halopseudomonas bauzanensis]WGK60339.1 electron transport complex subunit E [Halopseudomonas sp. SMJS2]
MADKKLSELTADGLWHNNPGLVQLLGLCPLLGVSSTAVNALGLGIATILVLVSSNVAVSLIRSAVTDAVRLPAFVMIIASVTTCIELLMQAYTYELFLILGIFIPLIVTNCVILGRADGFAAKNPLLPSAVDGFMMGLGFALVLLVLGMLRELLGQGTLFADMHLLLGPMAADWTLVVFPNYKEVLFVILPPGAFLVMGLLIALKNVIDAQIKARAATRDSAPVAAGSKRVRVTGTIN